MKVEKSNKRMVRYDRNKVIATCMDAGAQLKLASRIASEVKDEGYDGITTNEIRMRVYIKLKKIDTEIAERYVYRSNMKLRTSMSTLENFRADRIAKSLVEETRVNRSFAESIAKSVEKDLAKMRLNYLTAPLVREIVNVKLLEAGMESVRARYTRLGMPVYDVKALVEHGENIIPQYNPEAIHKVMSDQIAKEYALLNVLPFDLSDAHMMGQLHIHDLNYYCLRPTTFSHDLRFFLRKGLKVDGTGVFSSTASPAKKPATAFMHAIKVLMAGQMECSREQYIEDFNVILAPYIQGLDYEKTCQLVQMMFYEINQTSVGRGGQAIYAALTCDTRIPDHLAEAKAVQPGGRIQRNINYGDFEDEAQMLFKAIFDVARQGDMMGKPFLYPKLIVNVGKKTDDELLEDVANLTLKAASPYLMESARSLNGICRGTIQHVTLNLPQIAYQKRGDLYDILDNRLKKAVEILLLKRKIISRNLSRNVLPFLKQKALGARYYKPEKQQYVISYSGLEELTRLMTGESLLSPGGHRFGQKIMRHMMRMVETFRGESELDFILTGDPKGICYTSFAGIDQSRYPDCMLSRGGQNPYYSKSHYVDAATLTEKLDIEGRFNNIVNGRTITHIRLAEGEYSTPEMVKFMKETISRRDIRYLALSQTLTFCSKCGNTSQSIRSFCSRCRSRSVHLFTRDTGHIENMRTWTMGQKQAFLDEKRYAPDDKSQNLSGKQKRIILKKA
jgi:ribonucleoside-triphosphate reductase (formate)